MEVNFYLKHLPKKEKAPPEKCLIYLQFKYSGQKFVYSFGQKVYPSNWNSKKQRVKSNNETTEDGQYSLNELMDNLSKVCLKAYNDSLKDGVPGKKFLKDALDNFRFHNLDEDKKDRPSLFKLIDRFIAGEIQFRGRDKSAGSLNNYNSVKVHLLAFEKARHAKIDFDSITLDFFYSYVAFLKKLKPKNAPKDSKQKGLSINTIAKDITLMKVFMAEAVDLGYTNNLQFKHKKFSVSPVATDQVYLKDKEIMKLYRHDFSGKPKLESVRDLFVVGCFTGLRFGDYSNILPENIVTIDGDLYIKMITGKTKELVIIPCNPVVLEIFEKYKANPNGLPRSISNQKFNAYIKDACNQAELTEKGRNADHPLDELYKHISSHTARRSMATNLYLQGFPTIELMKITGHKTEKAFMKYIRVDKLDTAKRLSDHMKKNWSRILLSVAS
jgi:integrase